MTPTPEHDTTAPATPRCPTCKQATRPVPVRAYYLEHYWCAECRCLWGKSEDGMIYCELPDRHCPIYEDLMRSTRCAVPSRDEVKGGA